MWQDTNNVQIHKGLQDQRDGNFVYSRLTPVFVTICEAPITQVDLNQIIESGIRIIRFRLTHLAKDVLVNYVEKIKIASRNYCEKFNINKWPVAIAIDIPNAVVRTGLLDNSIDSLKVYLQENSIVEFNSLNKFWNKCNEKRIFINDPYTLSNVVIGTEVTLDGRSVIMECIEIVNDHSIKCIVKQGGYIYSADLIFFRGVKYARPPISKRDITMLEFAKEYKADVIIVNFVRYPQSLKRVRDILSPHNPLIFSTICDQVGLDVFDEILEGSDGIILAREYLAGLLPNPFKLAAIEHQITYKCKAKGKPCFVSGQVLNDALIYGKISDSDVKDVCSELLQGNGLLLRFYNKPENVVKAVEELNKICEYIEPMCGDNDFWPNMREVMKLPVNAAEGSAISAVLAIICAKTNCVILPTASGKTAVILSQLLPNVPVITVSSRSAVARRLLLYRGIVSLVYRDKEKRVKWQKDMWNRVRFAIDFALRNEILNYGKFYVLLKKSQPWSAYCDQVSVEKIDCNDTDGLSRYKYHNCEYQEDDGWTTKQI